MNKKKNFLKATVDLFRPFWKGLTVVFLLMLFGQIIATFSPYLFGKSIDAVTHKDAKMTFVYLGVAFIFSLFNSNFLPWLRESIELKKLDDHIEGNLGHRMLKKMLTFSIGQHINEHSGVKQSVVNRGMNAVAAFVDQVLYTILLNVLQIFAILVILAFFDWRIALVAVVFIIIYVMLALKLNKEFYPAIDEVRKKKQEQTKSQSEYFRNAALVISEGQEEKVSAVYFDEQEKVTAFHDRMWLRFLRPYYRNKLFLTIGQYGSLALGTYFILIGEHSIGMFVTFYSWTSSIFGNITTIMGSQRRLLFQVVEIQKLYDLTDIEPAIDQNPNGKTIEPLRGEIEFKNVSFSYPRRKSFNEEKDEDNDSEMNAAEEDVTISDISFTIFAGTKVGFVGVSGSGKSTIVNLMRRYYDATEGEILIDGVNIKDIDLRWLRSRIGNVEQKIDLFDITIRDNILFGVPKETTIFEEEINRAVKDASLEEFVSGLKEYGLDTMIGEGGIKVSGGERQRIGIARALIKDPKILIFDEATSALDSINEKLIHEAINRGSKGRTTIIIAHRLSTIMDADKIFVVANGQIVGEGKHAELLQLCKEYKDLIEHQIFNI